MLSSNCHDNGDDDDDDDDEDDDDGDGNDDDVIKMVTTMIALAHLADYRSIGRRDVATWASEEVMMPVGLPLGRTPEHRRK